MNLPVQCPEIIALPPEVMKLVKEANSITIIGDNARRTSFTKEYQIAKVRQSIRSDSLKLKQKILSQPRVITRHSSNDIGFDRWATRNQNREGDRTPSRTPPRRSVSADYAPSMPMRRSCEEIETIDRYTSFQPALVPRRKPSVRKAA